jgi:hypothetical protein
MESFQRNRGHKQYVIKKVSQEDPLRKRIIQLDDPENFFKNDEDYLLGMN